jgi:hypothetical protein
MSNTVVDVNGQGVDVPARRLDDVADDLGITKVDFLKMNIEGAERMALEGMERLIGSTRHVCVACHDFVAEQGGPGRMRTKAFVRDFLCDRGFSLTSREDAPDPWTRDYLYGVNLDPPKEAVSQQLAPNTKIDTDEVQKTDQEGGHAADASRP